jgi:hypothetical protein
MHIVQTILLKARDGAMPLDTVKGRTGESERGGAELELAGVLRHLGESLTNIWTVEHVVASMLGRKDGEIDAKDEEEPEELDVIRAAVVAYTGEVDAVVSALRSLMHWRSQERAGVVCRQRSSESLCDEEVDTYDRAVAVHGRFSAQRLLERATAASIARLPTAVRCALFVELVELWSVASTPHGRGADWAVRLAVLVGGSSALIAPANECIHNQTRALITALVAVPCVLAGGAAEGPAAVVWRALARQGDAAGPDDGVKAGTNDDAAQSCECATSGAHGDQNI